MDNISTPSLTTHNTSREIKQNSNISQNKVVRSKDLIIKKTGNGTTIALKPQYKLGWGNRRKVGEFNASASFIPGDEIRVMPNVQYNDAYNATISASWGTWHCIHTVPDQLLSDALIAGGYNTPTYQNYIRTPGVQYFPIWPEPTTNQYWELVGTLPVAMNICDAVGNSKSVYVGMVTSGSLTLS